MKIFSNLIIIFTILYFILATIFAGNKLIIGEKNSFLNHFFIFSFSSLLILIISFKFKDYIKTYLSISLLSFFLAIYTFEFYLFYKPFYIQNINKSIQSKLIKSNEIKNKDIDIDLGWTKNTILLDYWNKNIEVYPDYSPITISSQDGFKTTDGRVFPFGSISKSFALFGNEENHYNFKDWIVNSLDEYGFNNPIGSHKDKNIDILILGDSFAEGYTVNSNKNIAGLLRSKNYKVLNLGKGGNGPLIEYAIFREYANNLKPKKVFWLYYYNDLTDLLIEKNSKILNKYLKDENYTQNLIFRQNEIDNILKQYIINQNEFFKNISSRSANDNINQSINNEKDLTNLHETVSKTKFSTKDSSQNNLLNILIKDNYFYLKSILKLIHVRLLFELRSQSKDELNLFEDILQKTKRNIEKKGGEIIFVYLPAIGEYRGENTKDQYKDKVIETIKKLNIKTIDIDKEVFSKLENPKEFFSSYTYHYNERGYDLVYERILKELN